MPARPGSVKAAKARLNAAQPKPKKTTKGGGTEPPATPPGPFAHPHVEAANRYIDDVLSGKILACKWVKAACQRQRNDLLKQGTKDFPYRYDPKIAERKARFIELLPHVKDEWAQRRESIVLEPWQCFIICTVFGWVHVDTGKRRFSLVYIEVPRKNGKSLISAAVGLAMLADDKEAGAEVYCGATTEKQAWEVFRPAKGMADATPALRSRYGMFVNASNINIQQNGSRFEPVIGKPGDGASPSCAIVDEYHEHDTPDLYNAMQTGMGSRSQPLMWVITTAGDNLAGPCYDERLTIQKMLDGLEVDDRRFGIIYTIDEGDDWTSIDALIKANPNFGVSVRTEFLMNQQRDAIRNTKKQGTFKTKHLNVWVQARSAAFNMERWKQCFNPKLEIEHYRGFKAWLMLDLASEVDIAAVEALVDLGNGKYARFGKHYIPEETVEDPKNKVYQAWQAAKEIIVTGGSMIDFSTIEADILEWCEFFDGVQVGYDPFQATYIVTRLMDNGIPCIKYPQQVATMSPAMKRLDALIMAKSIEHNCGDAHPMTWQMSNVTQRVDAKDNIYPRKERPENKIDGPVALIGAVGLMMHDTESQSVYDQMNEGDQQAAEDGNDDGVEPIDYDILNNPQHPQFREMARRWEEQRELRGEDED